MQERVGLHIQERVWACLKAPGKGRRVAMQERVGLHIQERVWACLKGAR